MTTKRKYMLPNSREGLRAQMQWFMFKKSTIPASCTQPRKRREKKRTKLNPTRRKLEYESSHSYTEPEYESTRSPNRRAGVNDERHVNSETGDPNTLSPTEDGNIDGSMSRSLSKQWQDWGNGQKILKWNEHFQPLGKEAGKLATQLGYYARQGNLFPLNVKSWNKMETTRLDDVWEIVKTNTNAPNGYKNICLEKIGVAWKHHKSNMKQEYYVSKNTKEEQLANVPPTVEPRQWKDLVEEWSTEKSKDIAERNKKNREKLCDHPRTGRTSFSVIVEEMKEKNLHVDQLGVFRYTRQKNNQYCKDDGAAALEESIKQKLDALPVDKQSDKEERNKIFREVDGQDGHGRSLCMGTGIMKSTKRVKDSHDKVVEEEVILLNEKIDIQSELIENQQKHHQEELEM